MNAETTNASDARDTVPRDAIEVFIEAATRPSRALKRKELPPLREAAIAALKERYGVLDENGVKVFTPESAARIADPVHRFIVLAEIGNEAWTKNYTMDQLRRKRATAVQILRYDYGWKPMRLVRHMGAKERRVVDFSVTTGDKTAVPKWSEERALAEALKAHTEYTRREEFGEVTRPDRDKLMIAMSRGEAGDDWGPEGRPRVWSNAELSRLAKMTTAAVAQIRTGTAPSQRRAARAA